MKRTRILKTITAVILMMVFAVGCNKPDEPNNGGNNDNDVRVTTYSPQDITATTAKCGGDVIVTQGLSLTELGICWGKEQNPNAEQNHLSTSIWNQPFVCTITDLDPDTKYYVRAYALRGLVYYYGEELSFTTLGGNLPIVTTSEITNITTNSATGGGSVTYDGGVPITEQGICWSTNANPTIEESHVGLEPELESFTLNMNDLEHSTLYYVRAYAKNYYGVGYGSQVCFTTLTEGLPMVRSLEVTDIISNTAKGGGVVTSEGSCPVTERGICWSVNSNPTIEDAYISSGTGMGSFEIIMENLELNTTYYVRAYAENCNGIYYGSQVSFATPPPGGSINGHDYVDLGLPSGTLWATCNVGADAPEIVGDLFAWGETEPKTIYDWSTYKYCRGERNLLTKYCNNPNYGYNGFTDGLDILQACDDAAAENWGSGWRTPSTDEWFELFSVCNWTYTRDDRNVEGWSFIGPNGNCIFVPYNGAIAEGYWSNSIQTIRPYMANLWKFIETMQNTCYRYKGCSVRPVHSSK